VSTIGAAVDKGTPRLTEVGLVSAPMVAMGIDTTTPAGGVGTTQVDVDPVYKGCAAGTYNTLLGTSDCTDTGGTTISWA